MEEVVPESLNGAINLGIVGGKRKCSGADKPAGSTGEGYGKDCTSTAAKDTAEVEVKRIFVGGDFSEIDVINDGTVANFTNFGRVGGGELSLARLSTALSGRYVVSAGRWKVTDVPSFATCAVRV